MPDKVVICKANSEQSCRLPFRIYWINVVGACTKHCPVFAVTTPSAA